jgi:cell wall-associated NlpC family hydrolase
MGGGVPVDLSPYIVKGNVERLVNDVSTAELTIRNPDFKFTEPGNVTFHPMDPITIFMARNVSRPVRVFTGFLDTSPYLQLFPGTITLQASCTIKRLKHTYWDPALPFTGYFMKKYGWQTNYDGTITNLAAESQMLKANLNAETVSSDQTIEHTTPNKLNDSGLSNLLVAVMQAAGNWSYEDMLVEPIPSSLTGQIEKLWVGLKEEREETEDALREFLANSIGEPPEEVSGGSATDVYDGTGITVDSGTVQKAIDRVNAIDKKRQPYLWGGGHGGFNDPRGYDCSGFVSSVLHYAGLLKGSPLTTVGLQNWGKRGEGKEMTVWNKETGNARQSHCFITFGKGSNVVFAEAGGAEKGKTGWHRPRSTSGFEPRHWPGT